MERAGENQDFLSKIFCLTAPKTFIPQGNLLVFHKFPRSKKSMLQLVTSLFSVETFLSHSAEKFLR